MCTYLHKRKNASAAGKYYFMILSCKTLGNYDIWITSVRIRNALPDYEKLQCFIYFYILLVDT